MLAKLPSLRSDSSRDSLVGASPGGRLSVMSPRGAATGLARHLSECTVAIDGSADVPINGKSKVHYVLRCTDSCGFSWDVNRRFSEFDKLRDDLVAPGASALKDGGKIPFPRKTVAKASGARQSDREAELASWINTLLHAGYSASHTHRLQEFLEYPGLVNALRNRKHCVHEAVLLHAGADDIAELLEEEDACLMSHGVHGPSTLHAACQSSDSDVILRLLIKNPGGCDEPDLPSHKAIHHPIHEAARLMLNRDLVEQLVDHFPDGAHAEVEGALPLHVALEQGERIDWAVVEALLRANPDAACRTGPATSGQGAPADASGLPLHRAIYWKEQAPSQRPEAKEQFAELMRLLIVANPEAALQPIPQNPFPAGWLDEPVAEGVFAQAARRDKQPARREWGEVVKTNENGYVVLRWASDSKLSGEEWYAELTPVFKDETAQKKAAEHGKQISNPLFEAVRAFRRAALLTKVPPFVERGIPTGQMQDTHHQKINGAIAAAIELSRSAKLLVLHLAIALCSDAPDCVRRFLTVAEPRNPCNEERDFRNWLPVHRLVTSATVEKSAMSDDTMALIKEVVHKTATKHTHYEEVLFGSPRREQTTLTHWSVEHNAAPIALIFLEQIGIGADKGAVLAAREHAGADATAEAVRLEHTSSITSKDSKGRTVVELAKAGDEHLKRWAFTSQACLKRYTDTRYTSRLEERPMHSSRTAVTQFAYDQLLHQNVVLKWMRERASVLLELMARNRAGLCEGSIIPLLRWHTAGETLAIKRANGQVEKEQFESTEDRPPALKDHPYLLVLVAGERNAYDACANENLAGNDLDGVVGLMQDAVQCVHNLHEVNIVHGDIKTRNVLRQHDRWTLCDMDASADTGKPIGFKTSTGYAPPELAVCQLGSAPSSGMDDTLAAHPSFDIWSLGVVFYELCAGQPLFALDTGNDELIKSADKNRLCVWNTISDEELDPVFASGNIPECKRKAAKHLLRWCLKGNPAERPTTEQVIDFLNARLASGESANDDAGALTLPMKYHAFISHAQSDASGIANSLFMMYDQLGVRTWLDMRQTDLTLEGMRNGVIDSDVFLLILSEHTLERWFCIQELLCAIEHNKKIQIVLEVEPRFHPFNLAAWNGSTANEPEMRIAKVSTFRNDKNPWQAEQTNQQLAGVLCAAIDDSLRDAVTYRRRDFEAEAMMTELCERNKLVLPSGVPRPDPRPYKLTLICNRATATAEVMYSSIVSMVHSDWSHVELLDCVADGLSSADRVLLLLSSGVLERGSSTLKQLQGVIASEASSRQVLMRSHIVMVYDPATWTFGPGNAEMNAAPPEVRSCIQDHEAITFRALADASGRHEFDSMMRHLQVKLEEVAIVSERRSVQQQLRAPVSLRAGAAGLTEPELTTTAPGAKSSLETELRDAKAQIARQDAELATLRLKLSRAAVNEGEPPMVQREPEPEPEPEPEVLS